MKLQRSKPASRGFSLVEVMVALVVISVGLLGIAKMQAVAMSGTDSAKLRSLAAIEAASLASALHADRGYWASVTPLPFTVTTTGSTINTSSDAALKTTANCMTGLANACTTTQMAAYDLQDWLGWTPNVNVGISTLLPNPTSTITCNQTATSAPIICSITISWTENLVNSNTGGTTAAIQTPSYTLYVEP
jgi:type IV pilus assembly protein PilV